MKKTHFLIMFAVILIVQAIEEEDFYKLLEVSRDASPDTIKKSFRKLSIKYHPDKNPNMKDMFLKINRAYEILSDPEKKKVYDIYGEEGLKNENQMQDERHRQRGPSARLDIHVELEDLYLGAVKELSIQKNIVCNKCHGTGGKLGKTKQCPMCKGRGVVMQDMNMGFGIIKMQSQCQKCGGKGIIFSETCETCRGRKVIKEEKKLRIDIEKGMRDGQTIVFDREAEQHPDMVPGDLIVTLRQNEHKFFTNRENDLFATIGLNLKEALLGYSKKITHLDKREFYIEDTKPTQPFWVKRIDGEGMPIHKFPSQKGNLFVKLEVRLPEKLSDEEKELVKQLFS
jgi:DnaJ-related protein SCJ1